MSFEVVRNAVVEVLWTGERQLAIRVSGSHQEYRHAFPPRSRFAKRAASMDLASVRNYLSGGTFVFHDGKLVDFRGSDYNGFIQPDEAVERLAERIGVSVSSADGRHRVPSAFEQMRFGDHSVFLGGVGEDFCFDIAGLGEGGKFKNRILYRWSPFSVNIKATLEVERLVCSNGMVGISPLLTRMVPLLNDWEHNLRVISLNLRPAVGGLLTERLTAMNEQRATLRELERAHAALSSRGSAGSLGSVLPSERLERLLALTDKRRLRPVYPEALLRDNTGLSAHLPSDITRYDLFNVLTEASSHVHGSVDSTRQLQMLINTLVFDHTSKPVVKCTALSTESDPERVFFGRD